MTSTASSFERRSNRRRARSHRGQGGFGLLEAIIGMVMVVLIIGAGTAGLKTLQSTSGGANQIARLDTVLVGASEALRQLEYQDCPQPQQYEGAILLADSKRSADQQLLQQTAAGTPTLAVTDVVSDGCPAVDAGRQTVKLLATGVDGKTRTADVVKVDPKRRLQLPTAAIDEPPTYQTTPGAARTVVALTANDSTAGEGHDLINFSWDCGPEAEVTVPQSAAADLSSPSEAMLCRYLSPAPGDGEKTVTVTLTVEDNAGQTDSTSTDLILEERIDLRAPPTAVAAADVTSVNPGQTVNFTSAGSESIDGSIAQYAWDFRDPGSQASNTAGTADAAHTFFFAGTYQVKLTVTDDLGITASTTVAITVSTPSIPNPQARFANPGDFYAPAVVKVNGSASTDHRGNQPAVYKWDFDADNPGEKTATGVEATILYDEARTYRIRLTVEDYGGRTSFTERIVVVRTLRAGNGDSPNANFRVTGSRAKFPCIFFGCPGAKTGYMDFAWNKVPVGQGQEISVQINIMESTGVSPCWDNAFRTVKQTPGAGSQSYRWEEPNLDILNLGKTFCSGSNYPYRMRLVLKTLPGGPISYGQWTEIKPWGV